MPTSKRLATLPRTSTLPFVGFVIRLNIFNNVDLPAPLFPIIPSLSPFLSENEISFTAQNSSLGVDLKKSANPFRKDLASF